MAGAYGEGRSLKETPSWAVALFSAVFVIISILIEHGIHSLGQWFQKQKQKAMGEALEKIKSELMLLGFMSLLIAVATNPVSKICIPAKAGYMMLPCKQDPDLALLLMSHDKGGNNVTGNQQDYCSKHGKVSLISQTGVHQLHIFIFVLAVFHILYSVITMVLAQAKMKKWKAWELETTSLEYELTNDPSRFRLTRQTSFVQRHSGLSTAPGLRWVVAFFRQFFGSVTKIDYLTMRHGFINAHFAPNSKFDFHKYIKRSMEDDFKVVVGISIPLWIFAIIFQLLNVYRWYTLFVTSFMPPAILLLVGAKLEIIIMEMAREIQQRTTIVKGAPVVEPSNKYFWFNRPQLILLLIHFTLFENAFQMAYFLWTWYEFGITSCFHENLPAILAKVSLGIAFQVLCSYITFPLYALVTQMGSHMKRSIFEEQTARALTKWHKSAKERKKLMRKASSDISSVFKIISANSVDSSPTINHLLHKYRQHDQNSIDIESIVNSKNIESIVNSPKANNYCNSEIDMSEVEGLNSVLVSSDDHLEAKSPDSAKRDHEEDYHHDFS